MKTLAIDVGEDQRGGPGAAAVWPGLEVPGCRVPRISIHVFCESPALTVEMQAAAADRRMARAQIRLGAGGVKAAVKRYRNEPTPDLIILEAQSDGEALLAEVDTLATVCDVSTKVILVGRSNDIDLYRALMRRGLSEYLRAPVNSGGVISSVAAIFSEPSAAKVGRMYAFIGARGGSGSSTLAHNVAWTLGRLSGGEVILADIDLACGTAALDFDIKPERGLADAVRDYERLDDQMFQRLLAPCGEHLNLLAAPALLDDEFGVNAGALEAVLDLAQASAAHIVMDVPHLWSEWSRRALIAADQVVITAAPDLASLRNARNLVEMLRRTRRHDAEPLLVMNQVGVPKRPEIKQARFVEALGLSPLASLPFDPRCFGTAANTGCMLPNAPNGRQYAKTLRRISEALAGHPLKSRRFAGLKRLFGLKRAA